VPYEVALAAAILWNCLFSAVSSQEQTAVQKPQSPPDKSVQVSPTASGKHDSPAALARAQLSVSVDKQPAQVNTLRAAKSDALLFAVVVDTSRSDAGDATLIKKAALQLFQRFIDWRESGLSRSI
jgi:hypothetical protein